MENQPLTTNQQLEKLPNATAVLILGICSLVFGCLFAGLICGIISTAIFIIIILIYLFVFIVSIFSEASSSNYTYT